MHFQNITAENAENPRYSVWQPPLELNLVTSDTAVTWNAFHSLYNEKKKITELTSIKISEF